MWFLFFCDMRHSSNGELDQRVFQSATKHHQYQHLFTSNSSFTQTMDVSVDDSVDYRQTPELNPINANIHVAVNTLVCPAGDNY